MCRICEGNPPNPNDFLTFRNAVLETRHQFDNLDLEHLPPQFITSAVNLDNRRFFTGDEWGEADIANDVVQYIFRNDNPGQGLLLFIICCWLDMQAQYRIVWSTYLRQALNWINGDGIIPRQHFKQTTPHLKKTAQTADEYGGIERWFIQTITDIAGQNPNGPDGNLYRFVGSICRDLYCLGGINLNQTEILLNGRLPKTISGGDYKRLWMFIMFLRRDSSIIKCLFTRALSAQTNGNTALNQWYNSNIFNQTECELSVDRRVSSKWNELFNTNLNHREVAQKARLVAHQYGISPSVFDAICFF